MWHGLPGLLGIWEVKGKGLPEEYEYLSHYRNDSYRDFTWGDFSGKLTKVPVR